MTVLVNGVPVTGIAGAAGPQQYSKLTVPSGMAKAVYYVMLRGYTSYSGVTLTGKYS